MKEFKVNYRDEGRIKTAHVYAKTYKQAKETVLNLLYINEEAIIG